MLKLKYKIGESRVWWSCPRCGVKDAYFSYQPRECPNCDCFLPSFSTLLSNENNRISFYDKWEELTGPKKLETDGE